MTTEADILGRPPAMKPIERTDLDVAPATTDWRGEHLLRVPKVPQGGMNMKTSKADAKRAQTIARREKLSGLVGKGLTETDIAAQLGVSRSCILSLIHI